MARRRPNIVVVFPDQWRGQALSWRGDPNAVTPNLERLAAGGVDCPNGVSPTTVCTPARASLQTAMWPLSARTYTNGLELPTGLPTLARRLAELGYRRGWIGKWHLDGSPLDRFTPPGPRRGGWDELWAAHNSVHGRYLDPRWYEDDPEPVRAPGYEPQVQTDLAIDFVGDGRDTTPWVLGVAYGPPHPPYEDAPPAYRSQHRPEDVVLRGNVSDLDERHGPQPGLGGAPDLDAIAGYYAHVHALDDCVGRLLDHLDATGQAEDTIVVVTSDHGDQLWSQGREGKHIWFEESINVPMIWRWPAGLPIGTTTDAVIATPDVPATLLALAGARPIDGAEGRDVSAALRGAADGPDSALLARYIGGCALDEEGVMRWDPRTPAWRGLRTRRHTYVRRGDGVTHLFDNVADPLQRHDLAGQPEHASLEADLEAQLRDWLAATDDDEPTSHELLARDGLLDQFARSFEMWGLPAVPPVPVGAGSGP